MGYVVISPTHPVRKRQAPQITGPRVASFLPELIPVNDSPLTRWRVLGMVR